MGGATAGDSIASAIPFSGEDPFTHELRFLLTRGQATRFLEALEGRARAATFDPEHPISYTRTTYFDTADAAYLSSADDQPARRLRVRQYAMAATLAEPPVLSGVGSVELKQHLGASRSKVRLAASPAEMAELLKDPQGAIARAHSEDPLVIVARELAIPTMAPRLSTWYRRIHLITPEAPVRLTLDEGLLFCRPQPVGVAGLPAAPGARDVVAAFGSRILEVKHAGTLPRWLGCLLYGFRPAPEGFSKFRTGMEALAHEQALAPRLPVPSTPAPFNPRASQSTVLA
jgi:hypothetical protein